MPLSRLERRRKEGGRCVGKCGIPRCFQLKAGEVDGEEECNGHKLETMSVRCIRLDGGFTWIWHRIKAKADEIWLDELPVHLNQCLTM